MLNIGVPKSEFLKIAIWETVVYTVFETVLASVVNSFALKAVFNMFKATNVFASETEWNYPIQILLFTIIFCLIINIISIIVSTVSEMKNMEIDFYAENQ